MRALDRVVNLTNRYRRVLDSSTTLGDASLPHVTYSSTALCHTATRGSSDRMVPASPLMKFTTRPAPTPSPRSDRGPSPLGLRSTTAQFATRWAARTACWPGVPSIALYVLPNANAALRRVDRAACSTMDAAHLLQRAVEIFLARWTRSIVRAALPHRRTNWAAVRHSQGARLAALTEGTISPGSVLRDFPAVVNAVTELNSSLARDRVAWLSIAILRAAGRCAPPTRAIVDYAP